MPVGKTKCWLEKTLSVEKTNVGWRISPAKNGHVRNVRNSPECKTEKRQRREKNALGPIGEEKKKKNCHLEKKVFCRLEKQNVGWKEDLVEKKCWLENFPCLKRTCPECPEFPVMQDRKTAEVGKKRPRAY